MQHKTVKLFILGTASLGLLGATQMASANEEHLMTCKYVDNSAHYMGRPGKVVVKFMNTLPGYGPGDATVVVRYRGDLNGQDEFLKGKLKNSGALIGAGTLPGGNDANSSNTAPGSTYDPDHKYRQVGHPPANALQGGTLKFVFRIPANNGASWAVINKVKITYPCVDPEYAPL
ncbi:MAG: hypothetical protein ACWA5X_07425 [bacterium]